MDPVVLFIDSTHVKANANKRKYKKKHVRRAARFYQDELEQEINDDRETHGKKRFTPKKKDENDQRLTKENTTDPESGYYVKGEREKQFAYSFHTACDRNGFVLGTIVTPGNIHDSIILKPLLELIIHRFTVPFAVVADSAYKTAPIAHLLLRQRILPVFPYTRPKGVKGMFKTNAFYYDAYYDCYLCENNQPLVYRTITREGRREWVSDPKICETCPFLERCTKSQTMQKVIHRHIWQDAIDEVEQLRHTPVNK